ncbi:MAG: TIGR00730 family Rossman fold protein, partial [Desulfobacteraceae bacterium]
EMILAALKAGRETTEKADLTIMSSTLKELRYTATVFSGYRAVRKVSVFGSARTPPDNPLYRMARDFGRTLAGEGFMVITGGGAGIMQAVNEGAGAEKSFGVSIRLPFEQKSNPVVNGNPRDITFKYFFNRKLAFIKEACAVALFPGGFGTLDEAMEALTLLQTGKRYPIPVVLLDRPGGGYWSGLLKFMGEHLAADAYIGANDFSFFQPVTGIDEAVAVITAFYRRYHSLRFVGGKSVLRMATELPASRVQELRREFADMMPTGGRIMASGPLPEERDEPEIKHLPRLVVDFNKQDFARLRQLIDAINTSV